MIHLLSRFLFLLLCESTLQSLFSTIQSSLLACPPKALRPPPSQIRTLSQAVGPHTICTLFRSDPTVRCTLLLTSLQSYWCSFCFLNTPSTFSFQSPWACSPLLESSAQNLLIDTRLYCSTWHARHFAGRSFLTSQPKVASLSYSLILCFILPWPEMILSVNLLNKKMSHPAPHCCPYT